MDENKNLLSRELLTSALNEKGVSHLPAPSNSPWEENEWRNGWRSAEGSRGTLISVIMSEWNHPLNFHLSHPVHLRGHQFHWRLKSNGRWGHEVWWHSEGTDLLLPYLHHHHPSPNQPMRVRFLIRILRADGSRTRISHQKVRNPERPLSRSLVRPPNCKCIWINSGTAEAPLLHSILVSLPPFCFS